LAEIYVEK